MLRYSQLVKPSAPEVAKLLAEKVALPASVHDAPRQTLVTSVAEPLRAFRYINQGGLDCSNLDSIIQKQAGNCLQLSVLLGSLLRHAGLPAEDAFVFVGALRDFYPHIIHAYVVVRDTAQGTLLLVDPERMTPMQISAEDLMSKYVVVVLFNDTVQVMDTARKRALLAPASE